VGSHAAASKAQEIGGSGTFSPPLPFCTGGDNHHHLQKKKKSKQSFGSSTLFRYVLFWFLSFSWYIGFSSPGSRFGGWVASGYCLDITIKDTGGG